MKTYHNIFREIISLENLLAAWEEFERGKKSKPDVMAFSFSLMDNIIQIHEELASKKYKHDGYYAFRISDPKPRHIHKASVRDRALHRAVYRVLYPLFDPMFISDSFSCRKEKGTHKAMERFQIFSRKVSTNHTKTAWVLKCDIRKFFASIDQQDLMALLARTVQDKDALWLFEKILESFHVDIPGKGLPLGNITSQLFANIYMNELDQFVKQELRVKYYIRYADDFVFLSRSRAELLAILPKVKGFLGEKLKLTVHPDKIILKTLASGVDFLGFVHFPHHSTLRTATKKRMMNKIQENPKDATLQSYLGLIQHGDTFKLNNSLTNSYWLNESSESDT